MEGECLEPADQVDWLTGEFTGKKERLRRELRRLGGSAF